MWALCLPAAPTGALNCFFYTYTITPHLGAVLSTKSTPSFPLLETLSWILFVVNSMKPKQLLDNNSLWFIEVNIFFLLKQCITFSSFGTLTHFWLANAFFINFNLKLDLAKDHCMKGIHWAVNIRFQICEFHRHWNLWLWEDQVNNGVAALDIIRPGMDNGDCRVPITKPPRISFSIYVSSVRVQTNQLLYSLTVLYTDLALFVNLY